MAVSISKSLIIGVGTSGLEIINSARELFYEEVGYAGLPFVRFVHISSHTGGEPFTALPNEQFEEEWQKIKVLDASIDHRKHQLVRHKLNPKHNLFDENLAEWFNSRIINIPNQMFDAGAGNFRQAGRLCLWTNWESIMPSIESVANQMEDPDAQRITNDILMEYANRKNVILEREAILADPQTPTRLFIVGSLVGGTCSGIATDLGFYLHHLFPKYKRYGIFTVLDSMMAAKPAFSRPAANNYGAVVEFDYFTQDGTTFNYNFPSSPNLSDNTKSEPPFEYLSLLSTRNKDGTVAAIVNKEGEADLGSLHKMIGMSVFFDIFGGSGSMKEGIKSDFVSKVGTFPLVETEPHYRKCFSSFGATALWFPKSRISGAVASRIIQKMIKQWQGTNIINKGKVQVVADQIEQKLLVQLRERIARFHDDNGEITSITSDWNNYLESIEQQMTNGEDDIESILHALEYYPEDNPISARFKANGYYYKKIDSNIASGKEELINILSDEINNLIRKIFSNFTVDSESLSFNDLEELSQKIVEIIDKFAAAEITLNDSNLDYGDLFTNIEAIRIEQSRTLTWLIGVRGKVLEQHYVRVYNKLKEIYDLETTSLVDHFLVRIFKEIRSDIKNKINSIYKPYLDKLDEIVRRADATDKELSRITDQASLKMIPQGNSIEEDIKNYYNKINDNRIRSLIVPLDLFSLFQTENSDSRIVFGKMMNVLQREILGYTEVADFDIIKSISDKEQATLKTFATNAQPMLETADDFVPEPISPKPTLLAGGKRNSRENLKTKLHEQGIEFDRQMDVDLDHLIYFYREESLIAISEMKAYNVWHDQYLKVTKGDDYGRHIDIDPSKFDITRHHYIQEIKKENWLKISKDLFLHEMFPETDKNGSALAFVFKNEFGKKRELWYRLGKDEDFINKLARNKPALDQFREKFEGLFMEFQKEGVDDRLQEYLERLMVEKDVEKSDELIEKENNWYMELIEEKFKEK